MKSNVHKQVCLTEGLVVFAEGEKSGEEKEKDKRGEPMTEATDAKNKMEAADMKRGVYHLLFELGQHAAQNFNNHNFMCNRRDQR